MTKEEYLKLYEEWTMCGDVAKSKEICDKITHAAVDELRLIDEVYGRYHIGYDSPLNQAGNCVFLPDVDRVRLIGMNSCEVKLSLHTTYSMEWSDVLLNIKWFGDDGRKLLAKTLLADKLSACEDSIATSESDIEQLKKDLEDYKKERAELVAQIEELGREGKTESLEKIKELEAELAQV